MDIEVKSKRKRFWAVLSLWYRCLPTVWLSIPAYLLFQHRRSRSFRALQHLWSDLQCSTSSYAYSLDAGFSRNLWSMVDLKDDDSAIYVPDTLDFAKQNWPPLAFPFLLFIADPCMRQEVYFNSWVLIRWILMTYYKILYRQQQTENTIAISDPLMDFSTKDKEFDNMQVILFM